MNLSKLAQIREKAQEKMGCTKPRIVINMGTNSIYSGAEALVEAVENEVHRRHLDVHVATTGSLGILNQEPIMEVITPGMGRLVYAQVTPEKARTIIANHIVNHNPIYEWTIKI